MRIVYFVFLCFLMACENKEAKSPAVQPELYLTVLGTTQDGGYPHIGCQKACCEAYYLGIRDRKSVVSLGLVDLIHKKKWVFDATPDMHTQLAALENNHLKTNTLIDGVFLTHAHIGHYTGMMYFGREAYGKKDIPVYAMPKMKNYLEQNGPWSQLVDLENIELKTLQNEVEISLTEELTVTPFRVPHRDEFSETVGYKIRSKRKSALFIPDIDKWEKWEKNIIEEVKKVDYAFLDASFLKDGELERPMSEIPHPFVEETINLFKNESIETKHKIIFIHFNHTNPVLQENSKERKTIEKLGFRFASEGANYAL